MIILPTDGCGLQRRKNDAAIASGTRTQTERLIVVRVNRNERPTKIGPTTFARTGPFRDERRVHGGM